MPATAARSLQLPRRPRRRCWPGSQPGWAAEVVADQSPESVRVIKRLGVNPLAVRDARRSAIWVLLCESRHCVPGADSRKSPGAARQSRRPPQRRRARLAARTDSTPRKQRIRYSTATAPAETSRRSKSPDTSSNSRQYGHCGSSNNTRRRLAPSLPTRTPPSGVWPDGASLASNGFT